MIFSLINVLSLALNFMNLTLNVLNQLTEVVTVLNHVVCFFLYQVFELSRFFFTSKVNINRLPSRALPLPNGNWWQVP